MRIPICSLLILSSSETFPDGSPNPGIALRTRLSVSLTVLNFPVCIARIEALDNTLGWCCKPVLMTEGQIDSEMK